MGSSVRPQSSREIPPGNHRLVQKVQSPKLPASWIYDVEKHGSTQQLFSQIFAGGLQEEKKRRRKRKKNEEAVSAYERRGGGF
jgi:hypothetical protein